MTKRFHKHFSGTVPVKSFLWLALIPVILCFNGCGSVDENEKKADEKHVQHYLIDKSYYLYTRREFLK